MKYLTLCLVLVSFLAAHSCKPATDPHLIVLDSMKHIMWDLMKSDELYLRILAKDSTAAKRKVNIRLYEEVYVLHHIRKGQFDSTLKYYEAHPAAFKILVDSIDLYATREKNRVFGKYGQAH